MTKILIADDHPVVRRGLKDILEDEKDFVVQCEASGADEVLEKLRSNKIDIVLLDISMPGKSGLDLILDIKSEFPNVNILVLSGMSEAQFAKRAFKLGASGYLTKESAPDLLINAINKIMNGKKYISDNLAEIMANDLMNVENIKLHEKLSAREFEVLRFIGSGKSVGEIADILKLSVTTISTFRSRILTKLNLKNNSDIIQYCINENLLQ